MATFHDFMTGPQSPDQILCILTHSAAWPCRRYYAVAVK